MGDGGRRSLRRLAGRSCLFRRATLLGSVSVAGGVDGGVAGGVVVATNCQGYVSG